jgi:hypothetical protein
MKLSFLSEWSGIRCDGVYIACRLLSGDHKQAGKGGERRADEMRFWLGWNGPAFEALIFGLAEGGMPGCNFRFRGRRLVSKR